MSEAKITLMHCVATQSQQQQNKLKIRWIWLPRREKWTSEKKIYYF